MVGCSNLVVVVSLVSTVAGTYFYGRPLSYPSYYSTRPHPYTLGYRPPYRYYSSSKKPILAKVELVPGISDVTGTLFLKESSPGAGVLISGQIRGLEEGLHGFHVHMVGKTTDQCRDAGGHFNPFDKDHGDPTSLERHVGDLGNIATFSSAHPTDVLILDKLLTLQQDRANSVLGRAVVVHAGEDDLGRGGDEESLRTGNAGGRVSCGIIKPVH